MESNWSDPPRRVLFDSDGGAVAGSGGNEWMNQPELDRRRGPDAGAVGRRRRILQPAVAPQPPSGQLTPPRALNQLIRFSSPTNRRRLFFIDIFALCARACVCVYVSVSLCLSEWTGLIGGRVLWWWTEVAGFYFGGWFPWRAIDSA